MQERWNANMKVVIVGGVAGGATAAARIRRLNEHNNLSGANSHAVCVLKPSLLKQATAIKKPIFF